MKTPLVWHNIRHKLRRTFVAVSGVAVATLLIFMQLGFYSSAELSATSVYDALDFDLLVRSRDYLCLTRAQPFPRYRLQQALGHAEVASTAPLYIDWQLWRNAHGPGGLRYDGDTKDHNYRRIILVLAFNLHDRHRIFLPNPPRKRTPTPEKLLELSTPNTVFVDTYTRIYFGKHDVGTQTELNGKAITVVDDFTIGTGLGADGLVLMSAQTYVRLAADAILEEPTLGLIKLKDGARPAATIKEELNESLFSSSGEVEILTRAEVEKKERDYWLQRTPVAVIFTMGVVVAAAVGVVFLFQVLATDIADHSAEYATLRSIGYSERYISGVVLRQALAYGILGYIPGWSFAQLLYYLGREYQKILLFPSWARSVGVLLLGLAICLLSGLLAVYLVRTPDPADQF